ncbi:pyridoxamine 5'-phosphate oxidase family protein [Janibacter corallicola]|uniref:pyridoxamine 5'-phosphate oxidase family protein n=1 Tax=Janibacter corallicola TaxID=415212 RepID=UPI000A70B54D|nr:pyridoxamine 5'-phosphate oxidase family protein [Janibacter corallicola]
MTDQRELVVSVPMGPQDVEDPAEVHFITEGDSDKRDAIEARPQVNVSYASDSGWVSLSGVARREDDRDLLESLWSPATSAFVAGGKDDPNTTLLEVSAETAAYWESPGRERWWSSWSRAWPRTARPAPATPGRWSCDGPDLWLRVTRRRGA